MRKVRLALDLLEKSNTKKRFFLFLFFLAVLSSFVEMLPVELVGKISTLITMMPAQGGQVNLGIWILVFFFSVVVGSVVRNLFCYETSKSANTLIKNIRNSAFSKLLSADLSEIEDIDSGYCINMINGNPSRLETVFSVALFTLVSDIFDLLWISFFICLIDWKILCILLLFIPPLYVLGNKSSKIQKGYAINRIDLESRIIRSVSEVFSNLAVVRIFKGQRRESKSFDQFATEYKNESNKADAALSCFYVAEKTIRYVAISIVLYITMGGILNEKFAVGSFVTVYLYCQRFYSPITNIIRYLQMLQKGMASIEALSTFLSVSDVEENSNIRFNDATDFVDIKDAGVRIKDTEILTPTSFSLQDKTLNIICGESGSGKSTLLKAMLGLQKLTSGTVYANSCFDGKDLFSYASQDVEIVSGTILDNTLYPDNSATASWSRDSAAKSILTQLGFGADRWERDVGEKGCTLSGGEKKRISFARALLKPSKILLLDEITSNLDGENEAIVSNLIVEESRKRCVVLITHKDANCFGNAIVHDISKKGK